MLSTEADWRSLLDGFCENTEMNATPKIAITMGDPSGVGPEICLKLLDEFRSDLPQDFGVPIVLGDMDVLRRVAKKCDLLMPENVASVSDARLEETINSANRPLVVDLESTDIDQIQPTELSAISGSAAFGYIEKSIELSLAGVIDAVTTAPINKRALHMAGQKYPGHTEIFTEQSGARQSCMMQYSDEVTCSFVTTHVGYHEVPDLLTQERIVEVLKLSFDALTAINDRPPNFVVCGLNPHAGEDGLFGQREEERIISPAIDEAKKLGFEIEGPLPPDTCFLPARRKTTDCFICMYHDQGHIPLKALAFDCAVNCTLGLPIIRTSVDHGTAFDIAWKGIASPSSLRAAFQLATKLAKQRVTSQTDA